MGKIRLIIISIFLLTSNTVIKSNQDIQSFTVTELDSLRQVLQETLKDDPDSAFAHFQLGLVLQQLDSTSKKAQKHLKKATKLQDRFVPALYHLSLSLISRNKLRSAEKTLKKVVELDSTNVDAWLLLADTYETFSLKVGLKTNFFNIIDGRTPEKMVNFLYDGMLKNPESDRLFKIMVEKSLWYSKEEDAKSVILHLLTLHPENSSYQFALAEMEFQLGNFETCQNYLHSIQPVDSLLYKKLLLEAKTCFQINWDKKGEEYYWDALFSTDNETQHRVFLNDICYLLRDEELEEYSPENALSFFESFWRKRDPNLASEENERLSEHFRRLYKARKEYRRFYAGTFAKETTYRMDQLGRPADVRLGDEFVNEFASKALSLNRDLDDLGIIYVRHGEWDDWSIYNCQDCDQNISIKYKAQFNHPELIFHFRRAGFRGWFIESIPLHFENRDNLGIQYARLDPNLKGNDGETLASGGEAITLQLELSKENIEYVKVGLQTETSSFEFDQEEPFLVPARFLFFKEPDSLNLVEFYYAIAGCDVDIDVLNKNKLNFSHFIRFFDKNWNECGYISDKNHNMIKYSLQEWRSLYSTELDQFIFKSGTFYYEFQAVDSISNKICVYRDSINVPNFHQDSLMISDIILSGPINIAQSEAKFKKGELEYSPHMFHEYLKSDQVGIYFEPYNLTRNRSGKTDFTVNISLHSILAVDKKIDIMGRLRRMIGENRGGVLSSFSYSGLSRDDRVYMNLDVSQHKAGDYHLEVEVVDNLTGESAKKNVVIRIANG